MFDHHPFSIGISGGYSRAIAYELGQQADLVVAIGSSVNYYTIDGGHMFPEGRASPRSTSRPQGRMARGMKAGDLHLRADAKLAAVAN